MPILKVALLLPGASGSQTKESCRVAKLFTDLDLQHVPAELILYDDSRVQEVEAELSEYALVQVWVNPIHEGHDRSILDTMLRRVATTGTIVSTHPDTILKLGTKDVLYQTRSMPFGSDVVIYRDYETFVNRFPSKLSTGPRVLKQYRGNGGNGVWRVEMLDATTVTVLHAQRGSITETMSMEDLFQRMKPYFARGHLVDQAYCIRLLYGMTRVYMCRNQVIGFGHQLVTALLPTDKPLDAPPRLYYPKEQPEFQQIRQLLEGSWLQTLQQELDITTEQMPLLWDMDFLLGPKNKDGDDTYILGEVNVSSVYPYPESGNADIISTIKSILADAKA